MKQWKMETLVTRAAMSATADSVATTATMAALESEGTSNDSYGERSEDDGDKLKIIIPSLRCLSRSPDMKEGKAAVENFTSMALRLALKVLTDNHVLLCSPFRASRDKQAA